jgi:hypothetical protein
MRALVFVLAVTIAGGCSPRRVVIHPEERAWSCAQRCHAQKADDFACLRRCPGAVEEEGRTCSPAGVQPSSVCAEHAGSSFGTVTLLAGAAALVGVVVLAVWAGASYR